MELMMLHLGEIDFSSTHSLGGEIYVSIGNQFFPDERWYDMVSVDLDQWLPRLLSFAYKHTDICSLQFMDGPYSVRLIRSSSGVVLADCLWDGKELISKTAIDTSVFWDSVLKAIRKYRKLSYEKTGQSPYGNELSMLRAVLR